MTIVKLKENVRMFESDDSEFLIQGNEEKELPEKHLRSYSIKHHLFHGLFEIVEGEFVFKFKAGTIYVAKDTLYCKEYDKYFKKDLELDTITFIAEDEVPKDIMVKLNPDMAAEQLPEEVEEVIPEEVEEVIPEEVEEVEEVIPEESKEDEVEVLETDEKEE